MEYVEGRYMVKCPCVDGDHVQSRGMFYEMREWCYNTFDSGWGSSILQWGSERRDRYHLFAFNRLYHAQWFMMKYGGHEE